MLLVYLLWTDLLWRRFMRGMIQLLNEWFSVSVRYILYRVTTQQGTSQRYMSTISDLTHYTIYLDAFIHLYMSIIIKINSLPYWCFHALFSIQKYCWVAKSIKPCMLLTNCWALFCLCLGANLKFYAVKEFNIENLNVMKLSFMHLPITFTCNLLLKRIPRSAQQPC